ncbi:ATP-binding protein [Novosphingobium sp. P6W]|uniref:HAMP domain-containing sensor histidine kinase n=1 Tax=Novosphingobium sp. P6W TaxID=1609758 RepID=UPI0005C2C493|nr:ATP-binding protein [Novosphingobium sp. P6W]AXB79180.1 HAMP domain-containing protein [Novosphingobium sp. P6W]KIS31923.1 histidine kinase [Novosphingobium sp. P6W]
MKPGKLWRTTSGLVTLVALVFALVTVAIGAIAYEVTHEALEEQLDHRITTETAALLAEAHSGGLPAIGAAIRRREASRSTERLEYLLADDGGRIAAGTMRAGLPSRAGFEELLEYRRSPGGSVRIAQALTTRVRGGTLVVGADRADLDAIDRRLLILFSGALAGMLLVGIAAAVLIGWMTRLRLEGIDATAQAIIGGDLSRRVPRDGSDSEFDRLAGTLNRMLDRIEGLMESLRQVSSDVAHDLRTPLTRLCSSLERAAGEADPAARADQIENARGQAAELLEIFTALLRIAEVEGFADRLPLHSLDLSALVEQMAESYRPDIEDSGRHLDTRIEPGLAVVGDRRLLSQAAANLLDNCLRHTPEGTAIMLRAKASPRGIVLSIHDDGPGIPQEDRTRIFQRFARSERARSTPGHGLGLALVQAIVSAHGGHVLLEDEEGFHLTIELPPAS